MIDLAELVVTLHDNQGMLAELDDNESTASRLPTDARQQLEAARNSAFEQLGLEFGTSYPATWYFSRYNSLDTPVYRLSGPPDGFMEEVRIDEIDDLWPRNNLWSVPFVDAGQPAVRTVNGFLDLQIFQLIEEFFYRERQYFLFPLVFRVATSAHFDMFNIINMDGSGAEELELIAGVHYVLLYMPLVEGLDRPAFRNIMSICVSAGTIISDAMREAALTRNVSRPRKVCPDECTICERAPSLSDGSLNPVRLMEVRERMREVVTLSRETPDAGMPDLQGIEPEEIVFEGVEDSSEPTDPMPGCPCPFCEEGRERQQAATEEDLDGQLDEAARAIDESLGERLRNLRQQTQEVSNDNTWSAFSTTDTPNS